MKLDLVLKNGRVFTEGEFQTCCVGIKDGVIAAVCREECLPDAKETLDLKGQYVIPGIIDTHVHIRDPGLAEREDFKSGTMAAAASGVTLVMEHPVSSPSAYTCDILDNRVKSADAQAVTDFAFYGGAGVDVPEEVGNIAKWGIVGYKTFLHAPPVGRDRDFINVTMRSDAQIMEGFAAVAKTGKILMVHCENEDVIVANIKRLRAEGNVSPLAHCLSRPPFTEIQCVEKILSMGKETGARIGFAHISTPESMELIKRARLGGQDVYIETCPHYLFADESKLLEWKQFAKCNPPLRSKETVEGLWEYINDGSVDFIGSDHGGFTYEEKMKGGDDIFAAPSGFSGVENMLPLMIDAVAGGRLKASRLVELMSLNPAKIFGFFPKKGVIRVGSDADLVVYNLDERTVISKDKSYAKCKDAQLLFEGSDLAGKLKYTFVRGKMIMEEGVVDESAAGWGEHMKPLSEV